MTARNLIVVEQDRGVSSSDLERAALAPIAAEGIGEAWCDHWSLDPFVEGSYAAWSAGQEALETTPAG